METKSNYDYAFKLARSVHAGQYRRDGVTPYIVHPIAVAYSFDEHDYERRIVSLLHDAIEDCDMGFDKLAPFNHDVRYAILLVNNFMSRPYEQYVTDLASHALARDVKVADIRHNLSCQPSEKAKVKYANALKILGATP